MLDQILTNPALRCGLGIVAGAVLVAIAWGSAIIWSVEARYRAQRRADRIAAQMRTGRELRGMR
jgi:hypothetical protein